MLIIGGRRAGKSRLLEQLTPAHRWLDVELVPPIAAPIYFSDAGAWLLRDEADALGALLRSVHPSSGPSSRQFGKAERGELHAELERLAPLAIVIDEADRILGAPWAGDFLAWLRWLDGVNGLGSRISIIMAGGPMLSGYKNPDDSGSPPLNLSQRLYLNPLDANAIQQFIASLTADDQGWATRLCGGHPWLIETLLRALAEDDDRDNAFDSMFDQVHATFPVWEKQLGPDGVQFLLSLPESGIPRRAFHTDPSWSIYRDAVIRARYLCLVREAGSPGAKRYLPGSALFIEWLSKTPAHEWELAISYASEDEATARSIKQELRGHRVFFASDEQAYLWGEDLNHALPHLYGVASRFVVVLSTSSYVQKHWTLLEFQAALRGRPGNVLVVNLGELPDDLPHDLVYYEGTPHQLIRLASELRKLLQTRGAK